MKKGLVYQVVPQPSSTESLVAPLTVSSPSFNNIAQQCYNYRIDFDDPKEIIRVLEKYPILSIGGKSTADCHIELRNESDVITIQSKLKQSLEIKSLVQSLLNTNRYTGIGHIVIESDKDLNDDLQRYKIKANML